MTCRTTPCPGHQPLGRRDSRAPSGSRRNGRAGRLLRRGERHPGCRRPPSAWRTRTFGHLPVIVPLRCRSGSNSSVSSLWVSVTGPPVVLGAGLPVGEVLTLPVGLAEGVGVVGVGDAEWLGRPWEGRGSAWPSRADWWWLWELGKQLIPGEWPSGWGAESYHCSGPGRSLGPGAWPAVPAWLSVTW